MNPDGAAPADYPRDGDVIGGFVVRERIGGGGMGIVYRAEQPALGRDVALKIILPSVAGDEAFRARFEREARAQGSLSSANVVHVYAYGEDAGRLYVATQLVAGGDLAATLRTAGPPPVSAALGIVADVAHGLADAHTEGLIHRDIKPANVLLRQHTDGATTRVTAYLADFGIARVGGSELTRTGSGIGTPSYMAPELHTGGSAGVASDVYSLGCLLWATLTGQPPYVADTDYQLVTAHLSAPVPQLPDGSPQMQAINAILHRSLAKDPTLRHASAGALRDELRRAQPLPGPVYAPLAAPTAELTAVAAKRRAPTPTPSPAPTPGAAAPRGHGRVLLGVGLVAGLVLVGALLFALFGPDGSDGTTPVADDEPTTSATTADPSSDPSTGASPTPTPSGTPTEGSGPSGDVPPAESAEARALAVDALAEGFVAQGQTDEASRCAAEGWVEASGVPRLVETDVLEADYTLNEEDTVSPPQDVTLAGTFALIDCAGTTTP